MTVYTIEAAKKYFKARYKDTPPCDIESLIETHKRKAEWLVELLEDRKTSRRRKPSILSSLAVEE